MSFARLSRSSAQVSRPGYIDDLGVRLPACSTIRPRASYVRLTLLTVTGRPFASQAYALRKSFVTLPFASYVGLELPIWVILFVRYEYVG